jgi:hypothetical protein
MEIDEQSSSTRMKVNKEKIVVDLEGEEGSINQGGNVAILEKEQSMTSKEEKSITKEKVSQPSFQIQQDSFSCVEGTPYNSKDDLIAQYIEKKKQSFLEIQELFPEDKKVSQERFLSLLSDIRKKKTLNIAVTHEDKVSKVKIKLD